MFCANDKMAAGVIHCLSERGLAIPDDVALVGFDDRDLCLFVTPRLTTVALPLREMGRRAFEVLLANIGAEHDGGRDGRRDGGAGGEAPAEPIRGVVQVPCRLVERESTPRTSK